MRFTTIIGLSTVIAGVLLLPGLVLGVPGADPADTTETAAPSVTINAADTPGGAALTQTTSASPHGTVTVDTATLSDVRAAGSTARVFTVTNTDTQAAAVWIGTETDGLSVVGVENGETLDTAATAATLEPGETVVIGATPTDEAAGANATSSSSPAATTVALEVRVDHAAGQQTGGSTTGG